MLKRKASTTDLQVVAPHGGSDAMTQVCRVLPLPRCTLAFAGD